jgi:hypothetical protein
LHPSFDERTVVSVALPEAGQPVIIQDGDGREHRSQVIECPAADRLTLTRPLDLVSGAPLLIGDSMTLSWSLGAGLAGLVAAKLIAMRRINDEPVWDAQLDGEISQVQRRAHIRAPAEGAITVSQILDAENPVAGRSATGELVDVSETALRCTLDSTEIWATRRKTAVRVQFQLGDASPIELTGHVIGGPSNSSEPHRVVVVIYDQPVEPLDVLRAYVDRMGGH